MELFIKCKQCCINYIGQSQYSAKIRIGQHIQRIKHFKNNLFFSLSNYSSLSEVAIHFGDKNHNLNNDFSFFIIKSDLIDYKKRTSFETDLINIFITFGITLLNVKINNIETINSFSFIN